MPLWRGHRGEGVAPGATAATVVVTSLFEGVLVELLPAVTRTARDISPVHVEEVDEDAGGALRVRAVSRCCGCWTPRDALPRGRKVELDPSGPRHTGHACAAGSEGWVGDPTAGAVYGLLAPAAVRRAGPPPGYARPGRFPLPLLRAAGLPVRAERRFTYWASAVSYSVRRSFSPGASMSERKK